ERRGLEAAEQHVGERERQQRAGAVRIEAARAEIEHLVLVELADGRAVAALDVVGIDLEFRPRVDLRLVGEEQVVAALAGVDLLCAGAHEQLAAEDAAAVAVGDAAEGGLAPRVRGRVVDVDLVVHMPTGRGDEHAEEVRARAGAGELDVDIVARDASAEVDVARDERGVLVETRGQKRRAVQPIAVLLQPKDPEPRAFGLHYIEDDVQPAFGVVEIDRAHDDVERGVASRSMTIRGCCAMRPLPLATRTISSGAVAALPAATRTRMPSRANARFRSASGCEPTVPRPNRSRR